ncbi:STAS domain-containing protein [Jeotgalibacillus soli]|uniref:STAS domain-containing protein n=1 Tax=Jeotgalibacillus soli TaxID=889306 RepID=A0A0C2R6B4_9BACL|nr:STAS domain-containing protein [Jeotgalibacillus soli]KIL45795.1 hypothetical protein KP78_21440 [Jeotgalibacillus soli]
MTSLTKVADYFTENKESLAVEIVENVLNRMKLEIPEWEKELAVAMYIEFFGFLGVSVHCDKDTVPEDLVEWSKKNGEREASEDGRISEILIRYPATRDVFIEFMTNIGLMYDLSLEEHAILIKRINTMLDISLTETLLAYERKSDQIMEETKREMDELSAPVVPIRDGVAVLPLIGTIDYSRAAYLLDKVVPRIAEMELNYLIVDFSGILTIDIEIVQYLYNIESVLRLLGINTIVTGLRPDLAQTVVLAGIDMTVIQTFGHVKQALESIE